MNVELAMAALEDAKANPDRFDMDTFWSTWDGFTKDSADMTVPPCGTTGCYAGFAALRAAPVGTKIDPGAIDRGSRIVLPGQFPDGADGTQAYATKVLEITPSQAGALFFLDSIEEVERAVRYLADNPDADGGTLWRVGEGGE